MKYFPIKTALLCILLTPIFYAGSLNLLEKQLGPVYQQKIENRIIGDSTALLEGNVTIYDAVGSNIHHFLSQDVYVSMLKLDLDIMVTTRRGGVIYPMFDQISINETTDGQPLDSISIARQNYELLNQGLIVKVRARVRHGSPGAWVVLLVCSMVSLSVFGVFYRQASKKALKDYQEKLLRIETLVEDEENLKTKLKQLDNERQGLTKDIQEIQEISDEEKRQADIIEKELFEEIISLEEKLKLNMELQKEKEKEINALTEKLGKADRRKTGQTRRRAFDLAVKRFGTLYKNIDVNPRAVSKFFNLTDEQQIKAEEIIHQLNEDPSIVPVRRKVFLGKKNKSFSLEVLFSYNGRLYFRTIDNRIEVLTIGTKNTQDSDMEFLQKLS